MPKRFFALMLALLLAGVLAGCSKEEPPPPNMAATSAFIPPKPKKSAQLHKTAAAKDSTDASAGKNPNKNPNKAGKAQAGGSSTTAATSPPDSVNQANKTCRDKADNSVHGNLAALFGFRKPDPDAVYFDCMKEKGFEVKQ